MKGSSVPAEVENTIVAEEQPILWLGMAGFGPEQRTHLESCVARPIGAAKWRVCAFGEADAWWVNGEKVRAAPGGNLKVAAGLPTERALSLDLAQIDRPIAFAAPHASDDFEPRFAFEPSSQASIEALLVQFENWLRLLRAQFVLGKQIIERGARLRDAVYHVSHGGRLLAVLDFREGRAAILPAAHPSELWAAQWQKRPPLAGDLPSAFARFNPAQLAWSYVRRTERDMLPPRYRTGTIHYRSVPRVPVGWLRDSQLTVLRELAAGPASLAGLQLRTGLAAELVAQDVACLYYAGAVTTVGVKASTPFGARRRGEADPWEGGASQQGAPSTGPGDLTAPVTLEHRGLPNPSQVRRPQ
jgi:hypothetical protein